MKKIVMMFGLLLIGISCSSCSRPSEALLVPMLEINFNSTFFEIHYIILESEEYWESVDVLREMLSISEWSQIKQGLDENLLMTIVLSEEYEIALYESYACAYDGYAPIGKSSLAYYSLPTNVITELNTYITERTIS